MVELNKIYACDCLQLMRELPDECVDITVTSPPYNLGSRYANQTDRAIQGKWSRVIQYDDYQDNMSENDYVEWQQSVLRELWRITKSTGAIYYNHKPRIQKGVVWDRFNLIPPEITKRQVIIWRRPKGHNFNKGYFVPSYEWIFLLAKKDYKLRKGQSGYGDVWEISPARNDHAAPFPIDIPLRAISASANCNVVFDPFIGSGTTALAAEVLRKEWFGVELTQRWVDYSYARIDKETEDIRVHLSKYLQYYDGVQEMEK